MSNPSSPPSHREIEQSLRNQLKSLQKSYEQENALRSGFDMRILIQEFSYIGLWSFIYPSKPTFLDVYRHILVIRYLSDSYPIQDKIWKFN